MHKPSDYAHQYGEEVPSHWLAVKLPAEGGSDGGPDDQPAAETQPKGELATFRLIYESSRLCVFETRDGHLTAIDVNRLA